MELSPLPEPASATAEPEAAEMELSPLPEPESAATEPGAEEAELSPLPEPVSATAEPEAAEAEPSPLPETASTAPEPPAEAELSPLPETAASVPAEETASAPEIEVEPPSASEARPTDEPYVLEEPPAEESVEGESAPEVAASDSPDEMTPLPEVEPPSIPPAEAPTAEIPTPEVATPPEAAAPAASVSPGPSDDGAAAGASTSTDDLDDPEGLDAALAAAAAQAAETPEVDLLAQDDVLDELPIPDLPPASAPSGVAPEAAADALADEVEVEIDVLGGSEAAPPAASTVSDTEESSEEVLSVRDHLAALMGRSDAIRISDEDYERLSEQLTEAEVFVKYGLHDRAVDQLRELRASFPDHVETRKALSAVLQSEGDLSGAVEELVSISEIHCRQGELDEAASVIGEAHEQLPGERKLGIYLSAFRLLQRGEVGQPVAASTGGAAAEIEPPPTSGPSSPTSLDLGAGEEFELVLDEGAGGDGPSEPTDEELSEVDFYLEQRMLSEARRSLDALSERYPSHPQLEVRAARLDEATAPAEEVEAETMSGAVGDGDGASGASSETQPPEFFDLADELSDKLVEAQSAVRDEDLLAKEVEEPGSQNLDELLGAFRRAVDEQLDDEDYETRYNLGIAYKEMGLVDEAIAEFQFASRHPKLFLQCCSMLGICFRDKGMADVAVTWYQKGIEQDGYSDDDYQGLRYDLGVLYMDAGEYELARAAFVEVYKRDARYREVKDKLKELEELGAP